MNISQKWTTTITHIQIWTCLAVFITDNSNRYAKPPPKYVLVNNLSILPYCLLSVK